MLTAADLSFMQDTQAEAMPYSVVIERYTFTPDGMGGQIEAWAAIGTVLGRIYPQQQRSTNEMVGGAQTLSLTQWYGTLPVGTDVKAQDRLVYGSKSWEVSSVNNGEMWQTAIRLELVATNEERRT